MIPVMIDTDILSFYFRGDESVIKNFKNYLERYGNINISIITYYEIISGLKHRDNKKHLEKFLHFTEYNTILPLTEKSAAIAAEIYAKQRKLGESVDDIDLLIAGIAIANNLALITHNHKHFDKIPELKILDWK